MIDQGGCEQGRQTLAVRKECRKDRKGEEGSTMLRSSGHIQVERSRRQLEMLPGSLHLVENSGVWLWAHISNCGLSLLFLMEVYPA